MVVEYKHCSVQHEMLQIHETGSAIDHVVLFGSIAGVVV